MKKIIQLLLALFFVIPALAQTVEIVDIVDAEPGQVEVVINMNNFTGVGAIELHAEYDGRLLSYVSHTSPYNPFFNPLNTEDYPGKDVFSISFNDLLGVDIDGEFIRIIFDYSGNFDTEITFIEEHCEIAKALGFYPIPADYEDGIITAYKDQIDGTVSLGNAFAVAGEKVTVPLIIEGFDVNQAHALDLFIGFDPDRLTFFDTENNTHGFDVNDEAGVVKIARSQSASPMVFDGTAVLDIIFTYKGGIADVEILPGSYLADNDFENLIVQFNDGLVTTATPLGSLSIARVFSPGASGGVPDPVEVPIEAAGLSGETMGSIEMRISYDNSKLEYTGFSPIAGWNINHTDGSIVLSKTDASGFTIPDGDLVTLNFNYTYEGPPGAGALAEINFEPGTILQDINTTFILPELINGWVTNLLPGDANCDGVVNVLDVLAILAFMEDPNHTPFCFEFADVAEPFGIINVLDALGVLNIMGE